MGIPACLWRRTGEIYKGNKEFAALVGVPLEMLREGRLCIYELMAEESAVNYWEVQNLAVVLRDIALVIFGWILLFILVLFCLVSLRNMETSRSMQGRRRY